EGFYVSSVEQDSGAEKAGIQDGDIIKKLDNVEISKFADMKGFLGAKRPNDVVNVTIIRDGDERIIPVTLVKNETFIIPQLGMVKPASKNDLKAYKTDYGIRLAALPNNRKLRNYLEGLGINEGIIITGIDGQKINSIDDVKMILASKDEMDPITFEFINKDLEKERISFR
ncbi:MAG: PDZ domain-containing protein, partial [bacterium]